MNGALILTVEAEWECIMNRYPTKEEILQEIEISPTIIKDLISWKEKWYKQWSSRNNRYKNQAIKVLIRKLSKKNKPDIAGSDRFAYLPDFKTILVNTEKISIISTLHELAHHLFGPEELFACQWSVQLFRICFPKQYQKLEWKGHLLVKK